MTAVIIGIDPHKGSHTAVAIDAAEAQLGSLRVRASAAQAGKLLEWAAPWPERTWAVEGAGGLGHLLAQQLLAAGEHVLDIQPRLGSRARLLSSGKSGKNDPNDARSVSSRAGSRRYGFVLLVLDECRRPIIRAMARAVISANRYVAAGSLWLTFWFLRA